MPKHIIIKLYKIKYKEEILKAGLKKKDILFVDEHDSNDSGFLIRNQGDQYLEAVSFSRAERKELSSRVPYSVKLSMKVKSKSSQKKESCPHQIYPKSSTERKTEMEF